MPDIDIRLPLNAVEHCIADARGLGVALIADNGIVSKVRYEAAGEGFPDEIVRAAQRRRVLCAFLRLVGLIKRAERLLLRLLQGSIGAESELLFYIKPAAEEDERWIFLKERQQAPDKGTAIPFTAVVMAAADHKFIVADLEQRDVSRPSERPEAAVQVALPQGLYEFRALPEEIQDHLNAMIRKFVQGEVKALGRAAVRDVSVKEVLVGEKMHYAFIIPAVLLHSPAAA